MLIAYTPFTLLALSALAGMGLSLDPKGTNKGSGRAKFAVITQRHALRRRQNFDHFLDVPETYFNIFNSEAEIYIFQILKLVYVQR